MIARALSVLKTVAGTLSRVVLRGILVAALVPGQPARADDAASTSTLEWEFLEAETALTQDEPRVAASHYRGAVKEAWFLLGLIAVAEGELDDARDALGRARNAAAVDLSRARVALALVELRLGEVEQPLRELRLTAQEDHRDAAVLRRFVEALSAAGRQQEFRLELEKLRALDPTAAGVVEAWSTSAGREPPSADTGSLVSATEESRNHLRARLAASLIRATRNLAVLHRQTGFTGAVADLEAAADAVAARYPAGDPFGKVDLKADEPVRRVGPPRLDPVALLASEPRSLHPVLELIDAGDLEAAAAELGRRLAGEDGADENSAGARSLLGRLLAHQRDPAAEAELLRAIETPGTVMPGTVAPGTVAAHQALARLYWQDRRAEATSHLRRAAELGPLDRDLSLALAEIELAAGQTPAAERQLRSLDKRFGSVEALMRLVSVARLAGEEKRALEAAEKASRRAPNCEQVLLIHARQALEVGVAGSAARSVEPLVRMRPEVAEYRLLLGRTWSQRRKMGEASEAFLKAVELDPEYLPAFLPLGLALNHESRFAEAKGHLESYLETHPGDADALAGLAEAEERLGDSEAAERRALGVLSQEPGHARAHLVVGMVRAGRGELAEAREAFQQAVEADPLLAKAHYQLSLACARLRDRDCAMAHLERYKQALEGPESTYIQLEAAKGPTLMKKKGAPANDSPP